MNLIGDYHTHTIYSSSPKPSSKHAVGTIRENAEAALNKGLKFLAITEHGPSHYAYGVNKELIPEMREEIDVLNKEFNLKGLKILLGMESNIIGIDGTLDVDKEIIDQLDFLIMGYHYGAVPKDFKSFMWLYFIPILSKIGIFKIKSKKIMTDAFIKAMDKYPIDLISHPGSKNPVDVLKLANKAIEKDVALEVSSKHGELSIDDLKKISHLDIKLMLNSDAHKPEDVGDVLLGYKKVKKSGIDLSKIINIKCKGDKDEYK